MATYNRAHLIRETLHSIQNQTYKKFECIILDDGGSDNTRDILSPFLSDKRFLYYKRTKNYKKGLSGCRNFGLDKASGDYISFCDDDDIMHPQNLEICTEILKNSCVDFINFAKIPFSDGLPKIFDNYSIDALEKYPIGYEDLHKVLSNERPLASCTVMWKQKSLKDRFNENLQYAEELEFYSRLLMKGFHGVGIKNILYYARKHTRSNTGEFRKGNKLRLHSNIEASKLIIDNLVENKLFSSVFIKHFGWESVRLNSKELLHHLLQKNDISSYQKLKVWLRYKLRSIIKMWIRLKKQFK